MAMVLAQVLTSCSKNLINRHKKAGTCPAIWLIVGGITGICQESLIQSFEVCLIASSIWFYRSCTFACLNNKSGLESFPIQDSPLLVLPALMKLLSNPLQTYPTPCKAGCVAHTKRLISRAQAIQVAIQGCPSIQHLNQTHWSEH